MELEEAKKLIEAEKLERAKKFKEEFDLLCKEHNIEIVQVVQIDNAVVRLDSLIKSLIGFDFIAK